MSHMFVAVNLNDYVKVKLTDFGIEVAKKAGMGFHSYKPDANGYYSIQLWELMNVFGPEMFNGNPTLPFESDKGVAFPIYTNDVTHELANLVTTSTEGRGLLPPEPYRRRASHHWVQRIDSDGRPCGLEVYQWQPQAQKWCLPNRYAEGGASDRDLAGYEWVAECPTPPFPHEVGRIRRLFDRMNQRLHQGAQTVTLQRNEYEDLHRMVYEQVIGRAPR